MSEAFRIQKGPEKTTAVFPGIDLVSKEPIGKNAESAIQEVRDARILKETIKGDGEGFGQFQALLFPREGKWPEPEEMPEVVKEVFNLALANERQLNENVDALACHISVRVQGDAKARDFRENNDKALAEGIDPEQKLLHFDGHEKFGNVSGYIISFSGPTTTQYLGETELTTATGPGSELREELSKVSPASLSAVSLLPRRLYHITNYTPHAEPITLDEQVSDANPRLFIRLMFANLDPAFVTGKVYRA
ncbi:hypothetical protein KJ819_03280 [Patescibacteria group bacterium]|nr:hypothetical protein [Patescibacteria group bacterium]MBU1500686.1 hypothetical protein [Patescibacteria group bacterium]MBU2080761.1 hypothetical protein [Patescibacteria group bacterium]MBU2123866.1 hypothetical protein [Patescibacteria group bacterium]MBU2194843.1 hypothetical protein [Patescibacteria group bacterium]